MSPRDEAVDGRWQQVTYTSADDLSGGRGGWGVKATTPGMAPQTIKLLEREFKTNLDEVTPTPAFAPTAVLEGRVRRMLYRLVDDQVCLWHAAAAGNDATGRPGNVFNHAAVLPAPAGLVRPIELWRSPDLLTPFGPTPVAQAQLSPTLRPGTAVTRESVAAFIGNDDRIYALEWLLAAVDHAFRNRLSLLLTVPDPDEGALWMGAISYATSAPHARQLGFVTYERNAGLERTITKQFCVVFMPPGELTPDDIGPGLLCLDPSDDLDDSDTLMWTGPHGQDFPARKTWQDAILNAFATGAPTVDLLALVDDVSEGMRDNEAAAVPLEWPLLTAMLTDAGTGATNRESRLVSCLIDAPPSALTNPHLQRLIDEVAADDSLRAQVLARTVDGSGLWQEMQQRAAIGFLAGGWRTALTVPQGRSFDPETYRAAATSAVSDAVDDVLGPEEAAMAAGRLIGFVLDHGLTSDPATGEPESASENAATAVVRRVMSGDRGISRDRWPELGSTIVNLLAVKAPGVRVPVPGMGDVVVLPPRPATSPAPSDWPTASPVLIPPPLAPPPPVAPSLGPPPSAEPQLGPPPSGPPHRGGPSSHSSAGPHVPPGDAQPRASDDHLDQTLIDPMAYINAPSTTATTTQTTNDLVDRLVEELRQVIVVGGEIRSDTIADVILVARGLEQCPLLRGGPGIRPQAVLATKIAGDMNESPEEQTAALRWLAAFHALGESNQLADPNDGFAPQLDPRFAREMRSRPGVAMDAVVDLLARSTPEVASAVLTTSLQRTAFAVPESVLGLTPPGWTEPLGWTAVQAAWPMLSSHRREQIVPIVNGRIRTIVSTQSGRGWSSLNEKIEQLQTIVGPQHGSGGN